jgi:diguanylate cyclase (GGDEF)-like protein
MQILAQFRRPIDWLTRQSRSVKDLIVIGLVGLPIYLAALWYEVLHRYFDLTGQHQNRAWDWLVVLVVCLGIAAKIFSVRRVIDLRREVAMRRKAETEAYHMARHDVLTGLPNRRWFIEDFERSSRGLPDGEACALLVVDLDNFKPINDVYGHRLGDEVLKVAAKRLTKIAGNAAVARLGGDEFGLILRYRLGSDAPECLARQIVEEISKPVRLAALALQVGVSVGVSAGVPDPTFDSVMAKRDGTPVETALRQADMAMYWAKAEGRNRYRLFDRGMDEKLQQRVELESEIGDAIAAGQIVPYYQPIVDLHSQETVGFEVLARWEHPTRGVIPPQIFIPIAEDTGQIGKMTDHLLEQAVRDAKNWPDDIAVSLNFSGRQISDSKLAPRILEILNRASFPPKRLMVEVTESAVVQRLDDAKTTLQALRHVGVRIALDDFGTGYSGLYHLRELDLDTIKIDRTFVGQMLEKPQEARIVKAIVSLGHALGLKTTAEGIQSADTVGRLLKLGCDTGQGYLFGRPQPASVVTAALREAMTAAAERDKTSPRPRRIA